MTKHIPSTEELVQMKAVEARIEKLLNALVGRENIGDQARLSKSTELNTLLAWKELTSLTFVST